MVRITLINGLVKKDYSDLLIGRWEITLVNGFLFFIDGKDYPFWLVSDKDYPNLSVDDND